MGRVASTIEKQILTLKERGMEIDCSEEYVKKKLLDIGYYRLGFYWNPFEIDDEHTLKKGTKFTTILDLYNLDVDLRYLLIKQINRIEVNFRTKIIYYVSNSNNNSPTWFVDPNVMNKDFIKKFDTYYNYNFKRNRVIAKHHKKYINDKYAPAWKTLEYLTFGNNLKIYTSLKDNNLKKIISESFGIRDINKFKSLMSIIIFVRNYCAHNGVIFDLQSIYGIPKLPNLVINGDNRHCLDSCMKVIIFILNGISEKRANELRCRIEELLIGYASKNEEIKTVIEQKINFRI